MSASHRRDAAPGGQAFEAAGALRRAFDESFAQAPQPPTPPGEDLLAIRLGEERWAFRLRDMVGLAPLRRLVPLPSRMPALLGLAGIGGIAVPVYDLGALLGLHSTGGRAPLLARCRSGADELAFSFDRFDGHLRIQPGDLFPPGANGAAVRAHVAAVARAGTELLTVVEVTSLVGLIRQKIGASAGQRET